MSPNCYQCGLVGDEDVFQKILYIDDISTRKIVSSRYTTSSASSFRSLDAQILGCSVRTNLCRKPRWEILLEQVWVVAFGDVRVAPKHDNSCQCHGSDGRNRYCRRAEHRLT